MEVITKKLGTDQDTGLEKELNITGVFIDIENEVIDVRCSVNLIYPTGKKQSVRALNYRRFNADGNMKFNNLKDSTIGQGIISIIQNDVNSIKSSETIEQDLAQL